jgi:hypothetical protein
MLDEIRSFFDVLRRPFEWPEGLPAIGTDGSDLRAESEHHWRLATEAVDKMEAMIINLYDAGADDPAAIDLLDEVVAILRRKDEPQDTRFVEIGKLLGKRRP